MVVEHAAQWRMGRAGLVAVPALARDPLRCFVVVELAHQRVVGRFADRLRTHVSAKRTEQACKPDVVVEADFLIAKEQHLVLEQGRLDLCEKPIIAQRIRALNDDNIFGEFQAAIRKQ